MRILAVLSFMFSVVLLLAWLEYLRVTHSLGLVMDIAWSIGYLLLTSVNIIQSVQVLRGKTAFIAAAFWINILALGCLAADSIYAAIFYGFFAGYSGPVDFIYCLVNISFFLVLQKKKKIETAFSSEPLESKVLALNDPRPEPDQVFE